MKICMIDEWLDVDFVSEVVGVIPQIEYIGDKIDRRDTVHISHGTICMALLVEALRNANILNKVQVIHFSITTQNKLRSYSHMLDALKYCYENEIDFVSLSIGVFQRSAIEDITKGEGRNPLIVAAASNDGRVTYPASLSDVLGVKLAVDGTVLRYKECVEPPDGIDVEANLPESAVTQLLWKQYGIDCYNTNSSIVPRVSAELIAKALYNKEIPVKSKASKWLAEGMLRFSDEFSFICNRDKPDEERSPTVFLPVQQSNKSEMLMKALELQRQFESLGYMCGILSEVLSKSDFEKGWYKLSLNQYSKSVIYYQKAVSDNPLLLLSDIVLAQNISIDKTICDWHVIENTVLVKMIIQHFSEEV